MRAIFMGTPAFAVPSLEALSAHHQVLAVYTQPDRPKGRGQQSAAPPVKQAAERLSLPVRQPLKVRAPEVVAELAEMRADIMVVVGYGQLIPQSIIDLPPFGIVNVHASLLPKYRGAAPIQWAIANGEEVTGVTTMRIDAGLDTGEMLLKRERRLQGTETAPELSELLAQDGAELLLETLKGLLRGQVLGEPQDSSQATLAPQLEKENGLIDWTRPAAETERRSRGFLPWPGTWTYFRGQRFNVWRCGVLPGEGLAPGEIQAAGQRLFAGAAGSTLELLEVQVEGRKRVPAAAFLNGVRLTAGERLG